MHQKDLFPMVHLFQINITLDCNHKDEYLIETECTIDQMIIVDSL